MRRCRMFVSALTVFALTVFAFPVMVSDWFHFKQWGKSHILILCQFVPEAHISLFRWHQPLLNFFKQFGWYFPSAAMRSITPARRIWTSWSYLDKSRICSLILNVVTDDTDSLRFVSWQKMQRSHLTVGIELLSNGVAVLSQIDLDVWIFRFIFSVLSLLVNNE